ncbi:MAG: primosomal protein N' [Thermincola sp.]|jgi:primosomal protein N' (replication factor Y)|nr:primosomal protein N' [Thermincola sp.]MDT3704002.1 primosomal protein N' [Thermincola sp.]
MTNQAYAEIIVDVSAKKLDRVFHYRIPDHMTGRLVEGMRVIVPFGQRTVEGYVVGFSEKPDVPQTKDIISVVDDSPLFNRDLLDLARWMSERYMCPLVEVMHSIMPAGSRMVDHRYALADDHIDSLWQNTGDFLQSTEKEIYSYIINRGKTPFPELFRNFGQKAARQALKKLTEQGLIKTVGVMKAKIKPRTEQILVSAVQDAELSDLIAGLSAKAPKQAAVMRCFTGQVSLPMAEAASQAGTTPATIRQLVAKGWLKITEAPVRRDPFADRNFKATVPLPPTLEQLSALNQIKKWLDTGRYHPVLLHGVTGSGKTEVYLQAIAHCLQKGREAVVLVPEISLTPQMVERFKGRFGDLVAVLHSRLTPGERFDEWQLVKEGRVKVVVGARSAVFAPFANPGLFIIDEEHESSYKQEDNPKYHARDVANARAQLCGSVVILGSATPALESFTRVKLGKYGLLTLKQRVHNQSLPPVHLVDLREEMHAGNRSIFSRLLLEKLSGTLDRGEQAILFLNRRGYSTFIVCRECGLVLKCPKCSISLTLHAGENLLRCHYCDFQRKVPMTCPQCGSGSIRHFGVGTQKVEAEVRKWFPAAAVARMDVDTTARKGAHEQIFNEFRDGKIDVLVGTQMIAKGLDFPRVSMVGVVTADTALNLPDFRSAERTFQLITQVAGRAGRSSIPGEVVVQTYNPEHYSIVCAQQHDYTGFYEKEMKNRELLDYPPFSSLVRIVILGMEENSVIRSAEILADGLQRALAVQSVGVEQAMLGPAPAPISKLRNRYRWQICVRGKPGRLVRRIIAEVIASLEKGRQFGDVGLSIDVDPLSTM